MENVPINRPGAGYLLDQNGRPREVHLIHPSIGELARATRSTVAGVSRGSAGDSDAVACVPRRGGVSRLTIPLSDALTSFVSPASPPYVVRMTVRTPFATSIPLLLQNPGGSALGANMPQIFGPGTVTETVPLTLSAAIYNVVLQLPAGSCVYRLEVGQLAFS